MQSCDFSFDNPKEANERGFNFDPLKVSHFLIKHRPREASVVLNRSFLVRHVVELFWRCVLPSPRVPEKTLAGFTAHECVNTLSPRKGQRRLDAIELRYRFPLKVSVSRSST